MAWLLPELDVGAEPERKPLEPAELEAAEFEPGEEDPEEVGPELDEPELDEPLLDDEPELAEVPARAAEEVVSWADPGRPRAIAPAAATLARVTVVVAERTRARPRALSAMARRRLSRGVLLLMCAILRPGTSGPLNGASRSAMK